MDITLLGPGRRLYTFETTPIIALSVAVTAFVAGATCWWVAFHRRVRFFATAASFGLGTAILTLLVNPFGWALLLPFPGFVYPVVLVSLFIVGGLALKVIFLVCSRARPKSTAERNARKSDARASL